MKSPYFFTGSSIQRRNRMDVFYLLSPYSVAHLLLSLKNTCMESPISYSGGHSVKVLEAKIFPFYSRNVSSFNSCMPVSRGATGRVDSHTVRELLRLGFQVRAGVRSDQRAEALVQGVQQMKLDGKDGNPDVQRKRSGMLKLSLVKKF